MLALAIEECFQTMESGTRRFELLEEIGRGSFGAVYRAEMVSSGGFRKQVALKLLKEGVDGEDDASRRLRDEARLLGRLRHRNIVQVDDLVRLEGRWAVVMEYVPGHDLVAVLTALAQCGESLPLPALLDLVAAVADALDAAYNDRASGAPMRVIHRDIKPSNIRITPQGDVKVLDFGIAWANLEGREAKTGSVRFGSLPYMPPERLLGGPDLPEGDVYSLGCVLYEMVTCERLGRAELSEPEHLAQKMKAQHEVRQRLGDAGRGVEVLLGEMLSWSPDERPSAGRVSRRCREIVRGFRGEDLHHFARRFLPRVLEWVQAEGRPVDRVLVESTPSIQTPSLTPLPIQSSDRPWLFPVLTGLLGAALAAASLSVYLPDAHIFPGAFAPSGATVQAQPLPPTGDAPADTAHPAPEAAPAPAPEGELGEGPLPEELQDVTYEAPITPPGLGGPPERLRAVKFSVPGATALAATCGDRSGNGTETVLVKGVPSGTCQVQATLDGVQREAEVAVYSAAGITCSLESEQLVCR